MNVPGHIDSFHRKLDRPRAKTKAPMTLACSISVYLRRNRVLMPSELSESSPDQAGSIQPPFNSWLLCDLLSPIGIAPGLQMA